jgi:hypothetical protein
VVIKLLGSEVDEEVVVPRIIQSDVKEMFIGEVGIDGGTGSIGGEDCDKFEEDKSFLSLGC